MPTFTVEYTTEAERLLLEQAIAFATQMRTAASAAPHGTVLAALECVALTDGRKLLRDAVASAAQDHARSTDAQKKLPPSAPKGRTPAGS